MNRLSGETSPYLLQHQHNPVDWYPWNEEALAKARSEGKPILLSIGYSACHWCHVMEHECFENPEIARLMNENFVNIKVDREERPDLDRIYQPVALAITRGGGWPLTVFLTPELKPFFGGTYFPPEDRYGRPGFGRILSSLAQAFRDDPEGISDNARKLTEVIGTFETSPPRGRAETREFGVASLQEMARTLLSHVDWDHGGFGDAPKFPNPITFTFLWRLGTATGSPDERQAAVLALRKMAAGGIYDQLGGGFHRYSVDAAWAVPHFEKMLYDNGLLLKFYSEVTLHNDPMITADDRATFLRVIRGTVRYLLREMRDPAGGFYAAQDADSEGEEGKFFVWGPADLEGISELSAEEKRIAALAYGITQPGNFEHGTTVLQRVRSLADLAREAGMKPEATAELLHAASEKLFQARSKRIAPQTDTKILAAWNGLAISGLAWASLALATHATEDADRELAQKARQAAIDSLHFIQQKMARPGNRLFSTLQKGQPKLNAYLDDYAYLARAALDVARIVESDEEVAENLARAEGWIGTVMRHFKDPDSAGYFFTSDDHEPLIQRPKAIFDQALPSGTSVALECMLALAEVLPSEQAHRYFEEFRRQLLGLSVTAEENPYGCSELLCCALLDLLGPVVVSGPEAHLVGRHPHVFRGRSATQKPIRLVICHKKSCQEAAVDAEVAWREALDRTVFPQTTPA